MKTIEIRISGRVQGVYYRKSTRERALKESIKGTVRNKIDGSVEVVATGSEEQLGRLVMWCLEGPPSAKVHKVVIKNKEEDISFSSFDILYD